MPIPEQIRKQSEAVQELYRQMNEEPEGEKPEGETPSVEETTPPADEPPAESPAPSTDDEQPSAGGRVEPEETFAQRYKTLQGMYNAEVPRLHQQSRDQAQRIQQLEQLLTSLNQQQRPQQQQQQQQAAPQRLVSDKEVEEYGESLDVMRRVTREEFAPLLSRLTAVEGYLQQLHTNVVPQVQQVQQRQAQSAEQTFWSDLVGAVSNWREINDDPEFHSWLMEADPLTGITRQTYLEDAQRSLDARRVANFFRTWLENNGQGAVAHPNGKSASQAQSKSRSELERQVVPGRAKNVGATGANREKTYTPVEIATFYADVRQGKFKGREEERNRIERDIFAAQREGRIQ